MFFAKNFVRGWGSLSVEGEITDFCSILRHFFDPNFTLKKLFFEMNNFYVQVTCTQRYSSNSFIADRYFMYLGAVFEEYR